MTKRYRYKGLCIHCGHRTSSVTKACADCRHIVRPAKARAHADGHIDFDGRTLTIAEARQIADVLHAAADQAERQTP